MAGWRILKIPCLPDGDGCQHNLSASPARKEGRRVRIGDEDVWKWSNGISKEEEINPRRNKPIGVSEE